MFRTNILYQIATLPYHAGTDAIAVADHLLAQTTLRKIPNSFLPNSRIRVSFAIIKRLQNWLFEVYTSYSESKCVGNAVSRLRCFFSATEFLIPYRNDLFSTNTGIN